MRHQSIRREKQSALAEVPVYAVFGISVFSGKLTILFFVLLGSIMWFRLIQSLYDENTALFSTLLFITTPFFVQFSTMVMSEIPALALMITASFYFHQYLKSKSRCKVANVRTRIILVMYVRVYVHYLWIIKQDSYFCFQVNGSFFFHFLRKNFI